jgi:hypothetical protein
MRYGWRAALVLCLAVPSPACAGPSSDITSPPGGNNPPPEQPNEPNPPENPPPPAPPTPSGPPESPPPGPDIPNPPGLPAGARVLFIGNSLTEGNNLAAMVRDLADADGQSWYVEALIISGAGLIDHWNRGLAQPEIQGGDWDAVVLQQGPSSLPESRADLREWTRRFSTVIVEAGGLPALYMVWPDETRLAWFDRVRDSYALAARDVGGYFLPAGEAWRAAWRADAALPLYGGDRFHPTVPGSYAAALTIYAGLSGRSPVGLPAPSAISADMAAKLQQAAAEAIESYGDYGPADVP